MTRALHDGSRHGELGAKTFCIEEIRVPAADEPLISGAALARQSNVRHEQPLEASELSPHPTERTFDSNLLARKLEDERGRPARFSPVLLIAKRMLIGGRNDRVTRYLAH